MSLAGSASIITEKIKKRAMLKMCPRCHLLFKKSKKECPHCKDLTDAQLKSALEKRFKFRRNLGIAMIIGAIIIGVLTAAFVSS